FGCRLAEHVFGGALQQIDLVHRYRGFGPGASVETDHLMPRLVQDLDEGASHAPGSARDEDPHHTTLYFAAPERTRDSIATCTRSTLARTSSLSSCPVPTNVSGSPK